MKNLCICIFLALTSIACTEDNYQNEIEIEELRKSIKALKMKDLNLFHRFEADVIEYTIYSERAKNEKELIQLMSDLLRTKTNYISLDNKAPVIHPKFIDVFKEKLENIFSDQWSSNDLEIKNNLVPARLERLKNNLVTYAEGPNEKLFLRIKLDILHIESLALRYCRDVICCLIVDFFHRRIFIYTQTDTIKANSKWSAVVTLGDPEREFYTNLKVNELEIDLLAYPDYWPEPKTTYNYSLERVHPDSWIVHLTPTKKGIYKIYLKTTKKSDPGAGVPYFDYHGSKSIVVL